MDLAVSDHVGAIWTPVGPEMTMANHVEMAERPTPWAAPTAPSSRGGRLAVHGEKEIVVVSRSRVPSQAGRGRVANWVTNERIGYPIAFGGAIGQPMKGMVAQLRSVRRLRWIFKGTSFSLGASDLSDAESVVVIVASW